MLVSILHERTYNSSLSQNWANLIEVDIKGKLSEPISWPLSCLLSQWRSHVPSISMPLRTMPNSSILHLGKTLAGFCSLPSSLWVYAQRSSWRDCSALHGLDFMFSRFQPLTLNSLAPLDRWRLLSHPSAPEIFETTWDVPLPHGRKSTVKSLLA